MPSGDAPAGASSGTMVERNQFFRSVVVCWVKGAAAVVLENEPVVDKESEMLPNFERNSSVNSNLNSSGIGFSGKWLQ